MIPQRDDVGIAMVDAPEQYHRHNLPWDDTLYELNMQSVKRYTLNTFNKTRVQSDQLLVEPKKGRL